MAKDKLTDYDSTAANNLDVGGISVAEGMLPSAVNNAIRELMSHQAEAFGAGTPLYVDQTNNRVGIGTSSPAFNTGSGIEIERAGEATLRLQDTTNTANGEVRSGDAGLTFYAGAYGTSGAPFIWNRGGSEAMRIDSSGNLLVGQSSSAIPGAGNTTTGISVSGQYDAIYASRSSGQPLVLNRNTSDGVIADFRKDGTTVGSIGARTGDLLIGTGDVGLRFDDGSDAYVPFNVTTSSGRDNAIDLGASSARFDDIYATNGTIQTSDANEKQQIASLTDAEMTAAKAISALFKTFKWNDAVAEKGDAARTHTGVIAQDVQAAMTAAGLDAGNYAFFISSTWWETQTEVPAVEAVEAVYEDVVIPAVLDDEGNEVEPERTEQRVVTEAVEAADAYTRTDTYETAEEAPEGATERTRLGIRYPELLAFIGAATEQRLASIETRLTALENA